MAQTSSDGFVLGVFESSSYSDPNGPLSIDCVQRASAREGGYLAGLIGVNAGGDRERRGRA